MKEPKNKSALIAVSGGLDSVSLLFGLARNMNTSNKRSANKIDSLLQEFISENNLTKLEAIYLDHQQRGDIHLDLSAVQKICQEFKLKLHHQKLNLPPNCSEEQARQARYQTLRQVLIEQKLDHLITAHHADDVLETALINLKRGTGISGLHSLRHHQNGIWRPFLFHFSKKSYITKADLLQYAKLNNLSWHEDSTNSDSKYLRNRLRVKLNRTSPSQKEIALNLIAKNQPAHQELQTLLKKLAADLAISKTKISTNFNREPLQELDPTTKNHLIHHILSKHAREIDRKSVLKAVEFIQTAQKRKILQLRGCHIIIQDKNSFKIISTQKEQSP